MASSSRVRFYIEADDDQFQRGVRSAQASLTRFTSGVNRHSTAATRANAVTGRFASTTGRLGSSLASAARYAVGAAAAYLSISQAKAAVETTQELSQATTALHRNLGLSVKASGEWAAVARARDVETSQLNTSFTTLAKSIQASTRGGQTQRRAFEALGITQRELIEDQHDFSALTGDVAAGLGEMEGGSKRAAIAQTLLGRSAQTTLPVFAQGRQAMEDSLDAANRYGAAMGGRTLEAQQRLTAELRDSKLAWQGIQVSFTRALTPALKDANDQFQHLARILGSNKLTDDQKFRKIGRILEKDFVRAVDFISEHVLPRLIKNAGNMAPKIAGALVKGFLHADAWGKLAIGGWLFAKLGGGKAFEVLGARGGKFFGRAFIAAAVVALAAGAFKLGEALGKAVRTPLLLALRTALNTAIDEINHFIEAFNAIPVAPNVDLIGHITGAYDERQQAAQSVIPTHKGTGIIKPPPGFIGGHRQHGGPVFPSGTYIVGEKGPELFVPGTSGHIVPNNTLGTVPQPHGIHALQRRAEHAGSRDEREAIRELISAIRDLQSEVKHQNRINREVRHVGRRQGIEFLADLFGSEIGAKGLAQKRTAGFGTVTASY